MCWTDNDLPKKIELSNTVRTKRNELNLSIWAHIVVILVDRMISSQTA